MKNTMSTMVKHLVACSALLFLFICFAELLTGCASPVSANPRLAPHLDVSFHEMVNAPNGASYVFHVQWTTYSLPNEIWGRGEASISVPPTGVLGDYYIDNTVHGQPTTRILAVVGVTNHTAYGTLWLEVLSYNDGKPLWSSVTRLITSSIIGQTPEASRGTH